MNYDRVLPSSTVSFGAEELLRLILESAKDYAIFSLDLERRVTSWNPGAEALMNFKPGEILGRLGDILFVPEDRARGQPELEVEKATIEGRAENERWHLRKDGTRFYGSGLTQPLHDRGGTLIGFVKIMRDLTEVRAQNAREAFLLKLSDAVRHLSEPSEVQRAAMQVLGQHLGVNRAAYIGALGDGDAIEIGPGYSVGVGTLVGRIKISDFFGDEHVARLRSGEPMVLYDVMTQPTFTEPQRAAYDAIELRSGIGVPLVKQGKFVAAVVVHQSTPRVWTSAEIALVKEVAERIWDAVERSRAETALRENEAWLKGQKEAFQSAIDGASLETSLDILVGTVTRRQNKEVRAAFYILDRDGSCLHPVSTARGMPEAYLRKVDGFNVGDDSIAFGLAVAKGVPVITPDVFEEPLWRPWMHLAQEFKFRGCWSFPILTHSGKSIGTFAMYFRQAQAASPRDLSLAHAIADAAAIIMSRHTEAEERKRAEAALRKADQRKGEFLAMLGHELRNPLAALEGGVKLLQSPRARPESRELTLPIVAQQVAHMKRLIDDVLDLARLDRGKLQVLLTEVDLKTVIDAAVHLTESAARARGSEIRQQLPPTIVRVRADVDRLAQVFTNLLINAVKFSPAGSAVDLIVRVDGSDVVVTVRDYGHGIDAQELEQIFQPFVQAKASLDVPEAGIGLGLAVAYQLVELHHGSIAAFSEGVGRGSDFVVRLPLSISA